MINACKAKKEEEKGKWFFSFSGVDCISKVERSRIILVEVVTSENYSSFVNSCWNIVFLINESREKRHEVIIKSESLILTYVQWCGRYDNSDGQHPHREPQQLKQNLIGWARTNNCTARAADHLGERIPCSPLQKKKKKNNYNKNKNKLQQLEITVFKAMITIWTFNCMCERVPVWL